MKTRFLRAASWFVCFSFSLTSLNPVSFAMTPEVSSVPFKTLAIPSGLGQVTDMFAGSPGAPALIHIQSAHGNYAAEKNIENLLGFIEKHSKVRTVLLEGAASKLQPELFRLFPKNPGFNRKVTDKLMQEGYLTGPESFLVGSTQKSEGWGIEDLNAYKKDRDAFIKVVQADTQTQKFLMARRADLSKRFASKLNKDLLTFVRQGDAFDSETLSFEAWLKVLEAASSKHLRMDLADTFNQVEWPFLVRYERLHAIGSKIDSQKARAEAQSFLKELEKRKISQEIISSFKTLLAKPEAELFKAAGKSANSYSPLRLAFDKAFGKLPKDFSMKAWPNWTLYAQYAILTQELEGKGLHEEVARLKEKILDVLAQTSDEKEYVAQTRALNLLRKLFVLELTRSEYEELSSRMTDGGRRMANNAKPAPSTILHPLSEEISVVYQSAMDFYATAIVRENKMFANALQKMNEKKEKNAVIVTGGFHAEGLKKLAASKGCAYLQITPRIDEISKRDHEVYLRSILGARDFESSQMSALLALDQTSMSQVLGAKLSSWLAAVRELIKGLINSAPVLDRPALSAALSNSSLLGNVAAARSEARSLQTFFISAHGVQIHDENLTYEDGVRLMEQLDSVLAQINEHTIGSEDSMRQFAREVLEYPVSVRKAAALETSSEIQLLGEDPIGSRETELNVLLAKRRLLSEPEAFVPAGASRSEVRGNGYGALEQKVLEILGDINSGTSSPISLDQAKVAAKREIRKLSPEIGVIRSAFKFSSDLVVSVGNGTLAGNEEVLIARKEVLQDLLGEMSKADPQQASMSTARSEIREGIKVAGKELADAIVRVANEEHNRNLNTSTSMPSGWGGMFSGMDLDSYYDAARLFEAGQLYTREEVSKLMNKHKVAEYVQDRVETAFGLLEKKKIKQDSLQIYAQHFSLKTGAATGSVSSHLVEEVGAQASLVGHSERRTRLIEIYDMDRNSATFGKLLRTEQQYGDSDEAINQKLKAAARGEAVKQLLCVGEPRSVREKGDEAAIAYVLDQLEKAFKDMSEQDIRKALKDNRIAYEPIWAINTGLTATPAQAQTMHSAIRTWLAKTYSVKLTNEMTILYGGSAKPDNVEKLLSQMDIDGFLVGGASLQLKSFSEMGQIMAGIDKGNGRKPTLAANWKAEPSAKRTEIGEFIKGLARQEFLREGKVGVIVAPPHTLIERAVQARDAGARSEVRKILDAKVALGISETGMDFVTRAAYGLKGFLDALNARISEMTKQGKIPMVRNGIPSTQGGAVSSKRSEVRETEAGEVVLEKTDHIPGFRDVPRGQLFLGQYVKLYPLAIQFFKLYGGKVRDQVYAIVRNIGKLLGDTTVAIGNTKDPYYDLDFTAKKVVLNRDFVDFLNRTGRKKIFMSYLAGAVQKVHAGRTDVDTEELEVVLAASKQSLVLKHVGGKPKTRLDDMKALYELAKKVRANDEETVMKRYFLQDQDMHLLIADILLSGKTLDAGRLQRMLIKSYGYYGEITEKKAGELLEAFHKSHENIMLVSEVVTKDNIEKLKAKLVPGAQIQGDFTSALEQLTPKTTIYGLKKEFVSDPAFHGRNFIWDVETERQDEVNFGGKSAQTGELMFARHAVTLPNFFSHGELFQNIFAANDLRRDFIPALQARIQRLRAFQQAHAERLKKPFSEIDEAEHKALSQDLRAFRVLLEEDEEAGSPDAQVGQFIDAAEALIGDMESFEGTTLTEFFEVFGKKMDEKAKELADRKSVYETEQAQLQGELDKLQKEAIKLGAFASAEITSKIQSLQKNIEALTPLIKEVNREEQAFTAKEAERFLVAARNFVLSDEIVSEMKDYLRQLAERLGIDVKDLVLAIRSSGVGEDGETASFAGRQDTYIFVTPGKSTADDPDGLNAMVESWIFNQASLFNKRAIGYRFQHALPTFDSHAEISTLFQEMFLSTISFIAFSVDRGTGFGAHSIQAMEGQGEMLVSGKESGSQFVITHDGRRLTGAIGVRKWKVVETPDGKGKVTVPVSPEEAAEFAITDHALLKESARYFTAIHEFYGGSELGGYMDLEGAWRPKADKNGKPVYLKDPETGEVLKDERGNPRLDWTIVSTQARPETVISMQNPDIIKLRRIVVPDAAYQKAEKAGKVLSFEFIAKTGGTAQGEVAFIFNKRDPEELARAQGKIMVTLQSDPDMESAMRSAKGIIAILGGQNSHTMIVATEFGLIAITGTKAELLKFLKEGDKITLDAERGKIILGYDHELRVAGNDYNVRNIPNTDPGAIRTATIVATVNKAMESAANNKIPSDEGIGLSRLELVLKQIGIYPDLLMAYDNYMAKKEGRPYDEKGPILDPKNSQDRKDMKLVKEWIHGFNSGEDFYTTILSEFIRALSETLKPPMEDVLLKAQKIQNDKVRAQAVKIVRDYYAKNQFRDLEPLERLVALEKELSGGAADDLRNLQDVTRLLNKWLKIRLDDRKSDEYEGIPGATRFVKKEINPMKGLRGLELLLSTPTLRWQLRAIAKVAHEGHGKLGIFVPVVRRPQAVRQWLKIMDEEGLTKEFVKRGIMTEIPINALLIKIFLAMGIDFISTGGNDGEQTVNRKDRNASDAYLAEMGGDFSKAALRWNAVIGQAVKEYNEEHGTHIEAGFCGNAASVRGQDDYAIFLRKVGYGSVSVVVEQYEGVANRLVQPDHKARPGLLDETEFKLEIDPGVHATTVDASVVKIEDLRLGIGFHHRLLLDQAHGKLSDTLKKAKASREERGDILSAVDEFIQKQGISPNESGAGRRAYKTYMAKKLTEAFKKAQKDKLTLLIATDDATSDKYRALLGGRFYEPKEANPELGVRGFVKASNHDAAFTGWDLEVIAELMKPFNRIINQNLKAARKALKTTPANGESEPESLRTAGGLAFLLRGIQDSHNGDVTPEIKRFKRMLERAGLEEVPFGLDFTVAGNLFETKEIAASGAKFFAVSDPRQLASEVMTKEAENINGHPLTDREVREAVEVPFQILNTAAAKHNIPLYIGGLFQSSIGKPLDAQDVFAADLKRLISRVGRTSSGIRTIENFLKALGAEAGAVAFSERALRAIKKIAKDDGPVSKRSEMRASEPIGMEGSREFYKKIAEQGNVIVMSVNMRSKLMLRGIFRAAKAKNAPVIIQRSISEFVAGYKVEDLARDAKEAAAAEGYTGDWMLKLDHGTIVEDTEAAVQKVIGFVEAAKAAGYGSFSIDASKLVDFKKPTVEEQQKRNIEVTARIVKETGIQDAAWEGEIGEIVGDHNELSTPEEAVAFIKGIEQLGVRVPVLLAINNGSEHGNSSKMKINLEQTKKVVDAIAPWGVLINQHGITGTPLDLFAAIAAVKIINGNVGTHWQNIMWQVLSEKRPEIVQAALTELGIDQYRSKVWDKTVRKFEPRLNELLAGDEATIEAISVAIAESGVEHFEAFGSKSPSLVAARSEVRLSNENFKPVNVPEGLVPAVEHYGLKPTKVEILSLSGEAVPEDLLSDKLASFAVGSSIAQAFGSQPFTGLGKDVKEVADGNAVHFTERSLEYYTKQNAKTAVVVLGDEGARDGSFSLAIGTLYVDGKKMSLELKSHLHEMLKDLRDEGYQILYFVGDALEHTNGLYRPEALKAPSDSNSLFSFFIEGPGARLNGKDRFFISDFSRIGGTSFSSPTSVTVSPFDLPSVALPKIAKARGEDIATFMNHAIVVTLGPRASEDRKAYETSLSKHRHQAIIKDMNALKVQYPGLTVVTPGDGDLLPRIVAELGLDLDGKHMVVFGRSGAAEATAATIVAAALKNARFSHTFVSPKATGNNFSAATAYQYSGAEVESFKELSIPADIYNQPRGKRDVKGKGMAAFTSVTGASEGLFGKAFSSVFQRLTFTDLDGNKGQAVANTLFVKEGAAFIVRTTLRTEDLKTTQSGLAWASHAAREYWREKESARSEVRLADVKIKAREIKDSRGKSTVQVELTLGDITVTGDVPAGASKGEDEAATVSTQQAIQNINKTIVPLIKLSGLDLRKHEDLRKLEALIVQAAGDNFKTLGANATVPMSWALWNMAAELKDMSLAQYIRTFEPGSVYQNPEPVRFLMNIFNGGLHALKAGETLGVDRIDIQEIMIVPVSAKSYREALAMGDKVDAALKKILLAKFDADKITRADEAGFSVKGLGNSTEAIEYVFQAIEAAGYQVGKDVQLALDVAASSFFKDGKYEFQGQKIDSAAMVEYYAGLVEKYGTKIRSIEDGLAENDWKGWVSLTGKMTEKGVTTIGDDLYVTQLGRLNKGIEMGAATAILIKVNQNGTVSGTLDTIKQAKANGVKAVVSHRSGETISANIADLAVGVNAWGLKTGDPQPAYDFGPGGAYAGKELVRRSKYLRMSDLESYADFDVVPVEWKRDPAPIMPQGLAETIQPARSELRVSLPQMLSKLNVSIKGVTGTAKNVTGGLYARTILATASARTALLEMAADPSERSEIAKKSMATAMMLLGLRGATDSDVFVLSPEFVKKDLRAAAGMRKLYGQATLMAIVTTPAEQGLLEALNKNFAKEGLQPIAAVDAKDVAAFKARLGRIRNAVVRPVLLGGEVLPVALLKLLDKNQIVVTEGMYNRFVNAVDMLVADLVSGLQAKAAMGRSA